MSSLDTIEQEVILLLKVHQYTYDIPKDMSILKKVLDLFKNNIIDENCEDDDYLTYLGFYIHRIKKDKNKAIELYDKAINKDNVNAMYNLAMLYKSDGKKDLMEKYLKMGVKKDDDISMNTLGYFYLVEKRFLEMEEIFLKLVSKNDMQAINDLGIYYISSENNIKKGTELINIAISKQNYKGCGVLGKYYLEKNKSLEAITYILLYLENNDDYNDKRILLQKLIDYIIKKNMDSDFLIPFCKKYNIPSNKLLVYNHNRKNKIKFINNKRTFEKYDTCFTCKKNDMVFPFDCFIHNICEKCYYKTKICSSCNIVRHPIMNNNGF